MGSLSDGQIPGAQSDTALRFAGIGADVGGRPFDCDWQLHISRDQRHRAFSFDRSRYGCLHFRRLPSAQFCLCVVRKVKPMVIKSKLKPERRVHVARTAV